MTALAQTSQSFLDGMAITELVLHPPLVALTSLNFIVVFGTGCLHPNLRFILLTQSANIGLFELLRWLLTVQKVFNDGALNIGSVEIRVSFWRKKLSISLADPVPGDRNVPQLCWPCPFSGTPHGHFVCAQIRALWAVHIFRRLVFHFGRILYGFCFNKNSKQFTYCALNGYAYWQSAATTVFVLSSNYVAVCICIAEILVRENK